MNRVFCIALTLVVLPLAEGGFERKPATGSTGYADNYIGGNEGEWKHRGEAGHGRNTLTSYDNQRYPSNVNRGSTRKPGFTQRPTGASQGYKNTTAHIIDEDYLTSTENETLQHQNRPSSQYGGGGSYNKRPSTSGPYKNTTAHIEDEDYLTSTENEKLQHQNRPGSQYGGGGSYNKKPTTQASSFQQQQGSNTQRPSIHHQQRPTTQSQSFQNQQRPTTQSFQNQQRPTTQSQSFQNQHRPTTQSFQNQQRPTTQSQSFQNQHRPTTQSFQSQQRPTSGYPGRSHHYKRHAIFNKNPSRDSSRDSRGGSSYASSYASTGSHRPSTTGQGYKSTNAHIADQDYLTSNEGEARQHRQRPSSKYGGGGSYNKRDTTGQIVYTEEPAPNEEYVLQQEEVPSTQLTATHYIIPNASIQQIASHILIEHLLPNVSNQNTSVFDSYSRPEPTKTPIPEGGTSEIQNTAETPRQELNNTEVDVGNCIALKSDSITCIYSNIKDPQIENRSMRCNETDCKLQKNFEKSSFWICNDIKCTVANVDFSQDHGKKKLIECTMDERSIITVQDKPVKCGPDEKEHNGRCRKVFGA